jgi:RimJ/RimL family protein N-acetyltransferase
MRPTIEVSLRAVDTEDLDVLFHHQCDTVASKMSGFPSRDRASFLAHWDKILRDESVVARTVLADREVAGNIVSFGPAHEREVGYWIGSDFWGRGVASAALSRFLREVTTRPLCAHVVTHNVASIRVLETCGFTVSGGATTAPDGWEEVMLVLREPPG